MRPSVRPIVFLVVAATLVLAGGASAQPASVSSPTSRETTPVPPVLSTTPSPSAGASPEPSQMSGMPLQVGDLAPGIVAVRVIRRTFSENVANQAVELRVGATGRTLRALTNSDGRAQFDGLAVAETVQVQAAVEGEVLESQLFELPARGGVRLVLVAGVGAGVPANATAPSSPPAVEASAASAAVAVNRAPSILDRVGTGPFVMLGLGIAAVVVALWRRPRPATQSATAPSHRRAEVFEALVTLEKNFAASRVDAATHHARREALIAELVSLDLARLAQNATRRDTAGQSAIED